jgi:hypothetical protein
MVVELNILSFLTMTLFTGFYAGRYMHFDLTASKHISLVTVLMTLLMTYLFLRRSILFLFLVLARVTLVYIADIASIVPVESTDTTYTEKVLINPTKNMLTSTIFYSSIDLLLYTVYYISTLY